MEKIKTEKDIKFEIELIKFIKSCAPYLELETCDELIYALQDRRAVAEQIRRKIYERPD